MKKVISVLLILLILLTACGGKKTTKTEKELSATGSKSTEIKDKDALLDLIYQNYDVPAQKEYLKENMEVDYVDFTDDGKEDAICFMRDVREGFYDVVFITYDNGFLEIIPFEGDSAKPLTHFIHYDGKFIQYTFEHNGYGMLGTKKKLYVFDGEKIKDTGGMIDIEFSSLQPPSDKFPNGYEIETMNTVTFNKAENDYTNFTYESVITGSEEYKIKEQYIFNDNKMQFDVETLIDTRDDDSNSNQSSKSFYDPANIKVGQNIGGLKVTAIEYEKGEQLILKLKGNIDTKGVITGCYNEMYGENEFTFKPKNQKIDKPIRYTFNSGFDNSVINFEGECSVDSFLDQQSQNYILEGNELLVNANIKGFTLAEKDGTSGVRSVDIANCEIIGDENYIVYVEGENGKKPILQNEIFTTANQGDFYVDYAMYRCVIVPMHNTINNNKADIVSVDFGGNNTQTLHFTVFGEIQDVKINYVANMGEEGKWKDLGTISNSIVEINASLQNDMSSVIVHGRFHQGEGYYEDIKFSLDDMRDLSEYDIILFE